MEEAEASNNAMESPLEAPVEQPPSDLPLEQQTIDEPVDQQTIDEPGEQPLEGSVEQPPDEVSVEPQSVTSAVASSQSRKERVHQEALNVVHYRSAQSVADIGRECTALHHVFGADLSRKGNMSLIEHDTLIYATSTAVVFQNVATSAKEYLMSVTDNGIGCVAVHPSK